MSNPYTAKPRTAFWRKAVSGVAPFALDPMVEFPLTIGPGDKVATAGSCFAQNIARSLQARGMQYYVPEAAPIGMPAEQARAMNYSTFSARFGKIYTVRQLVQLFDRAHGTFVSSLLARPGPDRHFIDPFCPLIQPGGFCSMDALLEDRRQHLTVVREMFASLSVFVFTLGLTESWRHDPDGAIVPLAPGVAGGEEEAAAFSFVNFTMSEITADLRAFHGRLPSVNPTARLILTVSPVPLIATYEDRHVLVSTTYSPPFMPRRSRLRRSWTVCRISRPTRSSPPPPNRDRYFEDDLRSVSAVGVEHVMRVFFRHYVPGGERATAINPDLAVSFWRDARMASSLVCDEEAIDL